MHISQYQYLFLTLHCYITMWCSGTMKVFLSVTPVEGGSVVRVRTFVDTKVAQSWILKVC